ncbi:Hypothetical protein, putative [Bodo saltans]|uniref:Uncharacterized protein n=1 Tax=Bodo saltans TaxID=75058 RepID=A0A0S4JPI1_BODSA|nr:Hypothetical protein, putative [Bodo saltans]|eukprot:CUG93426.1 Hypothetical protein, putative [Bodo saltans]
MPPPLKTNLLASSSSIPMKTFLRLTRTINTAQLAPSRNMSLSNSLPRSRRSLRCRCSPDSCALVRTQRIHTSLWRLHRQSNVKLRWRTSQASATASSNGTEISDRDLQLTHKGKQQDNNNKRPRDEAGAEASCNATSSSSSNTMSICQWSDVPLDEQIARKEKHCISVMKKILQPNHYNGFVSYRTRFLGVMRSAQTEGYRNHVNFTYGKLDAPVVPSNTEEQQGTSSGSPQGEVILGFNEGAIVAGKLRIERADQPGNVTTHPLAMRIVTSSMKLCSDLRAACPNSQFPLEVLDRVNGSGF